MIYEDYLCNIDDTEKIILVEVSSKIKHCCRRCGKEFEPKANAEATASFYRCKECLSTKNFLKDIAYSCVIS